LPERRYQPRLSSQGKTAVQVSGCRECHQLALEMDGRGENSCVRCDQLDYLLGLVAELRDKVDRLRSIRESEREIG